MSNKYLDYGVDQEQAKALEDLEKKINKPLPRYDELEIKFGELIWDLKTGVKIENNNVIGLSLQKVGLTDIPESIGNLTSLRELWLGDKYVSIDGNKLTTLPESIGNLKFLEKLDLKNNQLISLPDTFKNLKSLKILNLDNNYKLKSIPNQLYELTSLRELYLNDCGFHKISELISNLKLLEILNISQFFYKSNISNLPESIGNLTSLKELDLNGNKLKNLPDSLGNLKSLTTLKLHSNRLCHLPISIGSLHCLKTLDLGNNNLKSLPESIGNLKMLEFLDLSDNLLTYLPESFGNLISLKELKIVGRRVTRIPKSEGLMVTFRQLKEKDLRGPRLKILPESFGNLDSLQILNLENNDLAMLPRSFGQLTELKELNLYNNRFKEIPSPIWPLKNLEKLNLDENILEGVSKDLLEIYKEREIIGIDRFIKRSDIPNILKFCREKASINLFISHAVANFKEYRVKDLSDFLEKQIEVNKAYYCESDLRGNIDIFMNETIPKCQLIIFLATRKSIYDSADCIHEVKLAKQLKIPILPIKGKDVNWEDLESLNLNREFGIDFFELSFDEFCNKIYEYITDYKRKINLFDKQEMRFKEIIFKKTEELEENENNRQKIVQLLDGLDERLALGEINQETYERLYKKWSRRLNEINQI